MPSASIVAKSDLSRYHMLRSFLRPSSLTRPSRVKWDSRQPRLISYIAREHDSVTGIERSRFLASTGAMTLPVVLKGRDTDRTFASKWFETVLHADGKEHVLPTPYLTEHSLKAICSYELVLPTGKIDATLDRFLDSLDAGLAAVVRNAITSKFDPDPFGVYKRSGLPVHNHSPDLVDQAQESSAFVTFDAPLELLLAAIRYNNSHQQGRVSRLYIAQAPHDTLPSDLRTDLAAPKIVQEGDIYATSIWLGLEPTYTPWHRDPNPNMFWQVLGSKIVRLLPPKSGQAVFAKVQAKLGRHGNSRIRGVEMMEGPERTALHEAIWGDELANDDIQEARLDAGDALFIPKGWWHSVKSAGRQAHQRHVGRDTDDYDGAGRPFAGENSFEDEQLLDGGLNCSVNWWYRPSQSATRLPKMFAQRAL